MAKFLDTEGISHHINQIIKNAEDKLILISPYLKIKDRYKELIKYKDKLKKDIRIIYGKQELQPEEINWLEPLEYVRTIFCKNLHAKCYMNENEALITSMNLYEFSQINNIEMGILISKEEDSELFKNINEEVQRLINSGEEMRGSIGIIPKETTKPYKKKFSKGKKGFCIRCGKEIKLNPKVPYCKDCYKKWEEYKDEGYEEKKGVCHICGKSNKSSLKKPVCLNCHRKYKDTLTFPLEV